MFFYNTKSSNNATEGNLVQNYSFGCSLNLFGFYFIVTNPTGLVYLLMGGEIHAQALLIFNSWAYTKFSR